MVTPDTLKMDVQRLLLDIPKYRAWVNPMAWKDWEIFSNNIDKLSEAPFRSWNMQLLGSAAIKSNVERSNTELEPLNEDLTHLK